MTSDDLVFICRYSDAFETQAFAKLGERVCRSGKASAEQRAGRVFQIEFVGNASVKELLNSLLGFGHKIVGSHSL